MPVIIGATGTISKYKTFNMENNITCAINCNHRIAATLCILKTWLVTGT
jgi:hypothetical protein